MLQEYCQKLYIFFHQILFKPTEYELPFRLLIKKHNEVFRFTICYKILLISKYFYVLLYIMK